MTLTVDDVFRDYNTQSVPSSGDYKPVKSEIRRLLKSIVGGTAAVGDFEGGWDVATAYVSSAFVEYGGSLWLAMRSNVGVTPVEGADWSLLLPGVTVADGTIDAAKLINDNPAQAAIAFKLGLQTNGDYTVYVATTGNDTTGDGSVGNPYATPQKAWDSLPWLIKDKVVISIANGTYSTSSRTAASMDRPALIYLDGKKIGRRTDGPGGVMTGGVTFMGASKAGVIFQFGSAGGYTRCVYQTGHIGSVAFQNFTLDALTGAEAGIVAHRGSYVHLKDIDIDGNGFMTFGVIGEAAGFMEAIAVDVHHCAIGVQSYQGSTIQLSSGSTIHDCSSLGINVPNGGYVGLTTGSNCLSNITLQAGAKLDCTGISSSRVTISGTVLNRGGDWSMAFTDLTGSVNTYPGSRVNAGAMGWSANWTDFGGDLYLTGCKSYVAPATQSTVLIPLALLGDTKRLYVDATFELRDNTGAVTVETFKGGALNVSANGQTIDANAIHGNLCTIALTTVANRTGTLMPATQGGRFAGTPFSIGTTVILTSAASFSIALTGGSTANLAPAAGFSIGTVAGSYAQAICVWLGAHWQVTPLGPVRP
jgi:hypothetical protein